MLLIQKIYKGQQYPKSVLKGQKRGRCLSILRLRSVYILYIQINLLEKLKGLAQSVLNMVVTTYGQRCMFGQHISLLTNKN